MTQDDDRELKGWARSIDSLFAEVEPEGDAVMPSTDAAAVQVDPESGPVSEPEPEPALDFAEPPVADLAQPEPASEFTELPAPEKPDEVPDEVPDEMSEPDPMAGFAELPEPDELDEELDGELDGDLDEAPEPDPMLDFTELPEAAVETGVEEPGLAFDGPAEPDTAAEDPTPEVDALPELTTEGIESEAPVDEPEEEPRTPVELQLEGAVADYLRGTSDQRSALSDPVRAAAEEARAANALDGLARAMNALLVQPVPDPDAEALANELMNAATQMRMAILMGAVREERAREGLVHAYAKLGDPMAAAIAGALTETNDRLARKTYVSALVALGQSGMRVVEEMLEDSRWFVVRNGVAVLGEVGGETGIAHLTGTLAHEDPRVRRETVLSLARIGGEDAAQLVVGMLSDADADVRTAAARAVAVLKSERAFKPLLKILEDGDDDLVIEQVVRALGQLGDPAAVPLIEKRAVGSFFSKPTLEVRVAALSALGSIGTPHAMSLVEAAKDDKDANVRAVVQQVLAAK